MIKADIVVPKINSNMKPALNKALRQSVTYVRWKAVQKAPYQTGTLRSSIVEKVNNLKGTVWTNLVYAAIHEYGGIIKPKKWKYLVFQKGWKTIFAKKVRIPKRPYLFPALEESQSQIQDYFGRAIDLFIEKA